ncbi:hypothetical protein BV22DRAFT_909172 [Leucogyrophana mollusca]|uniref:Uncharacterized protein n=1 Tax=Leucogyrophana mollusca TaxID=85980 RepID=A0ACB8AZ50_9AGAM|nr:hypothetical protein BV22DRAFT_909172 [Leucogyrophana mollusca]
MQWASFSDVRPLKIRKISSCILFDLALVFIFLRVEPATMTTNFPSPSGITALLGVCPRLSIFAALTLFGTLVLDTVFQALSFISTTSRLWVCITFIGYGGGTLGLLVPLLRYDVSGWDVDAHSAACATRRS